MDAKLNPAAGFRPRGFSLSGDAIAAGVLVAGAAATALAVLIVARRLVGALERPAPVAVLLITAVAVGALSCLGRRLWRAARSQHGAVTGDGRCEPLVAWAPSVCLLLLTIGLSWPLGRIFDWLIWMPLWIADFAWRRRFLADAPGHSRETGKHPPATVGREVERETSEELDDEEENSLDGGVVLQRLTRIRDPQGRDGLFGSLRAELAAGERSAHVFISFCPPFEGMPTIDVEQSGGPPARIIVGQLRPHGARIDVRLAEESRSPSQVVVELFAACSESRCTGISAAV